MTIIPGVDYHVFWVPFPPNNGTDGGAVMPNDEDDGYSIYLDVNLMGTEKIKKAYRHEVGHIENDDFYNDKPIKDIEDI